MDGGRRHGHESGRGQAEGRGVCVCVHSVSVLSCTTSTPAACLPPCIAAVRACTRVDWWKKTVARAFAFALTAAHLHMATHTHGLSLIPFP